MWVAVAVLMSRGLRRRRCCASTAKSAPNTPKLGAADNRPASAQWHCIYRALPYASTFYIVASLVRWLQRRSSKNRESCKDLKGASRTPAKVGKPLKNAATESWGPVKMKASHTRAFVAFRRPCTPRRQVLTRCAAVVCCNISARHCTAQLVEHGATFQEAGSRCKKPGFKAHDGFTVGEARLQHGRSGELLHAGATALKVAQLLSKESEAEPAYSTASSCASALARSVGQLRSPAVPER